MTIHVSAAEFQARISELLDAARGGEEIVIEEAGLPQVRLAPVGGTLVDADDRVSARRRSALGRWAHLVGDREIIVRDLKQTDDEIEADWRRKFGPAD